MTSPTISRSAVVVKEEPRSIKIYIIYSARSRPVRSNRRRLRLSVTFTDWHRVFKYGLLAALTRLRRLRMRLRRLPSVDFHPQCVLLEKQRVDAATELLDLLLTKPEIASSGGGQWVALLGDKRNIFELQHQCSQDEHVKEEFDSVWKCAPFCFTRCPHCNLQVRVIGVNTNCNRALHARRTKIPGRLCPCAWSTLRPHVKCNRVRRKW